MTKRYNIIVILLSLGISAGIWIVPFHIRQPKKKKDFATKIFEGFNGWGYDILVADELFIHQESIPSRPGKAGFRKKEQAEQTALLIINKMKQGRLPTVTTFELQQIIPLNQMQHVEPDDPK
ncbi:MAG: DUF4907 domain-containing protein [Chitinophagaceae bacterium]